MESGCREFFCKRNPDAENSFENGIQMQIILLQRESRHRESVANGIQVQIIILQMESGCRELSSTWNPVAESRIHDKCTWKK